MRFLNQTECNFSSLTSQQLILFSFEPVVIHKEVLNLIQPLGRKVFQFTDVGVHVVRFSDSHESIIPNLFLSIELLAFNYANESSVHSAAWKGRLIHQQKHIDRISIWSD